MASPFDFVNAITFTKEDLLKEKYTPADYNSYMVNRGLSNFVDTVMYANEMNKRYDIPPEWQFQFLLNTITKKKRFSKWAKKEPDSKSFLLVKEYFGYSDEKTRQVFDILSESDLEEIEQKLYKGGK